MAALPAGSLPGRVDAQKLSVPHCQPRTGTTNSTSTAECIHTNIPDCGHSGKVDWKEGAGVTDKIAELNVIFPYVVCEFVIKPLVPRS